MEVLEKTHDETKHTQTHKVADADLYYVELGVAYNLKERKAVSNTYRKTTAACVYHQRRYIQSLVSHRPFQDLKQG